MSIKKAFLIQTHTGPIVAVTRYESFKEPGLVAALALLGITKFVAHELPLASITEAYKEHYRHLMTDPKESDEFMVLDDDGERVYTNIRMQELGKPVYFDKIICA